MAKYIAQDKCLYTLNKDGGKGKKIACSRKELVKHFSGLFEYDKKAAKDELKEAILAFEVGKKRAALMAELDEMRSNTLGMYENVNETEYENALSEIEKMHNEMKRLYNEISKLK